MGDIFPLFKYIESTPIQAMMVSPRGVYHQGPCRPGTTKKVETFLSRESLRAALLSVGDSLTGPVAWVAQLEEWSWSER